jgi:hypothetical protein
MGIGTIMNKLCRFATAHPACKPAPVTGQQRLAGWWLLLLGVLLLAGPANAQEAICARVKIEIQQELT